MIRFYFTVFFLTLIQCSSLYSQTFPLYSHFANNPMMHNPASAGSFTHQWNNFLLLRKQWLGVNQSPSTMYLSSDRFLNKYNIGLGGTLLFDKAGPLTQYGFALNTNYKIYADPINDGMLSIGIGLRFDGQRYSLNNNNTYIADDPLAQNINKGTTHFDTDLGINYHTESYQIGLSAQHLLQKSENDNGFPKLPTTLHFFASSYFYNPINNFNFVPSILVRYTKHVPIQFDANLLVKYKQKVGLGLGYRNKDAIMFYLQYYPKSYISIGYSYDYTLSMRRASSGSHEIFLSYDILKYDRD